MPHVIQHNREKHRFEVTLNGCVAVLEYEENGNQIAFTHTGVPNEFRGQGIASALAKVAMEYASERQLTIIPLCPYVAAYIARHRQYQHLLDSGA